MFIVGLSLFVDVILRGPCACYVDVGLLLEVKSAHSSVFLTLLVNICVSFLIGVDFLSFLIL